MLLQQRNYKIFSHHFLIRASTHQWISKIKSFAFLYGATLTTVVTLLGGIVVFLELREKNCNHKQEKLAN